MKRSITRWTTTLTAAAILGLPATGLAQAPTPQPPSQEQAQPPAQQPPTQQPSAQEPPAQQSPTQEPPVAATPQSETAEAVSSQEHLRQAKAALDSIKPASVTGRARTQLATLTRHMSALERAAATAATGSHATGGTTRADESWGIEIAAMDKVLTELLANGSPSAPSSVPGATGTTGTIKAPATVALDEETRNKLMEVRKHITAYAVSMSRAQTPPKAGAATTAGEQPPAMTAASSPTAPTAPATTEAAPRPQVDPEAARRHLTAARGTLTQLTQVPAAAQLTGETRTQVSQLIANFNDLITTESEWRRSYAKVAANLTALLGPDTTMADPTGGVPSVATETAATGIVGTSGTTKAEIDPAVRAKLVELRRHLAEFETAMGGSTADKN